MIQWKWNQLIVGVEAEAMLDSGLGICWFFRFCFRLRHPRLRWIISDGVVDGIGRNENVPSSLWLQFRFSLGHKRSHDSDYDSDYDSVAGENQPLRVSFKLSDKHPDFLIWESSVSKVIIYMLYRNSSQFISLWFGWNEARKICQKILCETDTWKDSLSVPYQKINITGCIEKNLHLRGTVSLSCLKMLPV